LAARPAHAGPRRETRQISTARPANRMRASHALPPAWSKLALVGRDVRARRAVDHTPARPRTPRLSARLRGATPAVPSARRVHPDPACSPLVTAPETPSLRREPARWHPALRFDGEHLIHDDTAAVGAKRTPHSRRPAIIERLRMVSSPSVTAGRPPPVIVPSQRTSREDGLDALLRLTCLAAIRE